MFSVIKYLNKTTIIYRYIKDKWNYIFFKIQFGAIGKGSKIGKQILLTNRKSIKLGLSVVLMPNSRIELIRNYAGETFDPEFIVGNYSQIHQNCHITCAEKIEIGNNVVIVSNVTITDIVHPHEDVTIPINKAKLKTLPVKIEDEVYIYNNSVILPGTFIGKHSIIGANSVVNKNIPPYSIAVGNPAKVVKQYNFVTNLWEKI
jgi:acetyltransferase-like isoleucine patch superfamily enzyme